jgi:phospholipid N-methyltransferase
MARVDYDQMAASYDRGRPVLDLGAGTGLFAFQTLQQVPQVSAPSLRAAVERVRQRADSTLEPLPDEQFAQGLAALERAAAAESARPR